MSPIDRTTTARSGPGVHMHERVPPAGRGAERWQEWFAPADRLRPRPVDVLLALAIAVVQIAGTISYSQDETPSPWAFDAYAYVLLAVGPVALLSRRRWPEATLVVAFLAAAGYAATGYPRGPAGFPALSFAIVNAIMMGRRAFTSAVLVLAAAVLAWLPYVRPTDGRTTSGIAIANTAWLLLVGAASEIARIRLERHAERADAAREEARRRASEERLLIARELHDVLAHNISLINVQSGVALHLLDERPAQARPALEVINETSEEALRELRSVLDVLSRGLVDDGLHDGSAPSVPDAPTAGLRDLDDLVRRIRATGLDIQLAVEGEVRAVPAAVDLAAFRIVQEALTNIVRHAGDDVRATVRLVYGPTELVVQIDDDGRGAVQARGVGRGLAGMRQRAHALGGTVTAAPRPSRGFRVRAQFPLHAGPR